MRKCKTSPTYRVRQFIAEYLNKPENKHVDNWTHLLTLRCAAFQVINDVDACRTREQDLASRNKGKTPRTSVETLEEKIFKGKSRLVTMALCQLAPQYSDDKKYIRQPY